jgi:coenzyme F420-0:L-glutamate ligase/coenzyme F420-1:gamma-L-glutamate ligase
MPTSADDLHDFLRTRRSIRRFKTDPSTPLRISPVADSVIERILTSAAYAPSAHNLQPWRFGVVTTSVVKARLGQALTSSMRADMQASAAPESEIEKRITASLRRMDEAPVIIVLCRDVTAVREHKPQDEIMSIQSVAAAGLQLLLAAHAEGLGGNWICWPLYAQEATRKALDLLETWEPQAMFFLGYSNETPEVRERKMLQKIMMIY